METSERRSTQRAAINAAVTEEYLSDTQQVKAVNICEHGMHYSKPLGSKSCKGKEVFLTFSLVERLEPIKVLSWVVEERETKDSIETHVTFMFLPAKDEILIRDYVASKGDN
jgi:hypothetical protein